MPSSNQSITSRATSHCRRKLKNMRFQPGMPCLLWHNAATSESGLSCCLPFRPCIRHYKEPPARAYPSSACRPLLRSQDLRLNHHHHRAAAPQSRTRSTAPGSRPPRAAGQALRNQEGQQRPATEAAASRRHNTVAPDQAAHGVLASQTLSLAIIRRDTLCLT